MRHDTYFLVYRRKVPGVIDKNTDSLSDFPFCENGFRKIQVLGQGFDKKLLNEEVLARFFRDSYCRIPFGYSKRRTDIKIKGGFH